MGGGVPGGFGRNSLTAAPAVSILSHAMTKRHHSILHAMGSCDKYCTEFARSAARAIWTHVWTHISGLEAFPLVSSARWDACSLRHAGNAPVSLKLASVQEHGVPSETSLMETGRPCWPRTWKGLPGPSRSLGHWDAGAMGAFHADVPIMCAGACQGPSCHLSLLLKTSLQSEF